MARGPRIRVLVCDDSLVAREMLAQILTSDPGIEVVGMARDGLQCVEMVQQLRPDLVTMDIHMPRLDGLQATERIMAFHPTPILVVSSSVHGEGTGRAFDALAAGALEVMKKPEPRDWAGLGTIGRELIRLVKILSRVKVITHVKGRREERGPLVSPRDRAIRFELLAVGSSTGGPSALMTLLGGLPSDFPVPIVVAQHMADGFVPGLVGWLDSSCAIGVKAAEHREDLRPSVAYVAPTGSNLVVEGMIARLAQPLTSQLYVPSADTLFSSVAVQSAERAVGVLLTGMGVDGARGLKSMRERGAYTIAQDERTCTVFGMPKAAIEMGAAVKVMSIWEMSQAITGLFA